VCVSNSEQHTHTRTHTVFAPPPCRNVINDLINRLRAVVPPSAKSPITHYARGPNNNDHRPKVGGLTLNQALTELLIIQRLAGGRAKWTHISARVIVNYSQKICLCLASMNQKLSKYSCTDLHQIRYLVCLICSNCESGEWKLLRW
jgi:hypothetical protein